jgi:hypothetical protein
MVLLHHWSGFFVFRHVMTTLTEPYGCKNKKKREINSRFLGIFKQI